MKKIISLFIILFASTSSIAADGKLINYQINNQSYEGYYISPCKQAPLVLLIHDWDGLTEYEIKRSNMLADLGYAVFALDLFGAGVRPTQVKDKRQHTGELYKDRQKMRALMEGALIEAQKQGANTDNAVVTGYCFGGAAVLEWARSGVNLKGFATFHGGLQKPEGQDYSNVKGQILILHGTADSAIPMEQFAKLAKELESASVHHEMITYSGAQHAFTVFNSSRYKESADKKSWARFKLFLIETIGEKNPLPLYNN